LNPLEQRVRALLDGRYRIEREIGRGGMATVYLGEDQKHHRSVAIKVLDPDLSAMLGPERFRQEIAFAARLQHPHILTLLDSGAGDGLLYYVMPYVEGESLRSRLDRERQLSVDEALRLTEEVARALDYAHRQGIVHRDIKPENILLADGEPMISDFGIARAVRAAGGEQLTQSGTTLGTPPYMSPEQLASQADVDGRSDLYSLGCVLYEMLAGQPPFTGPPQTLAHQHLNLAPRPVSEMRPTVPGALDEVLQRALAKTPADRFATASQLADAVRATSTRAAIAATPPPAAPPIAIAGPAPSVPAEPSSPVRAPSRRGAGRAAVLIALFAIVGAIAAWRSGLIDRVLHRSRAPVATQRQWLWLASFNGPADDPSMAGAARDLVAAALDQSERVATVPAEQVRIALRNAGRPESTRVDGPLARELAYRSSIPVVVEGSIGRIGSGYSIALNATNASDGHVIFTTEGTAADEGAIIPALTRLARELRKGLGERSAGFRVEQTMGDAPTPSFEAFKLYVRGRTLINDDEPGAAVPILRRALALDSAFAVAWGALGTAFANMGQPDSGLAAQGEALKHPERLTELRRLDALGKIALIRGDSRAAMEAYDGMLKLNPSPTDAAVALNNLAIALSSLGQDEQALAMYRRAAAAWPIAAPPISDNNIASALIGVGRPEESRAVAARMKGDPAALAMLDVLLVERDWVHADSIAMALDLEPRAGLLARSIAGEAHASILAARGELGIAARVLDRIQERAAAEGRAGFAAVAWSDRAWLAYLAGHEAPSPPAPAGQIFPGPSASALGAAMHGDSAAANRWMAAWSPNGGPEPRRTFAALIAGWLDWRRQRWSRVLEDLRETARGGLREGVPPVEGLRLPARWLMADAFEKLSQPDSAAVYLGLMLDPPGRHTRVLSTRGLSEPFVRRRLVALNVALGRIGEARRQWDQLAETCTRPNPPLAAMLYDTRTALLSAEAMRGAARK
jgi:tetratricopeptide (TPR) repeat protein